MIPFGILDKSPNIDFYVKGYVIHVNELFNEIQNHFLYFTHNFIL